MYIVKGLWTSLIEGNITGNIDASDDLCELYCGGGNFTIPLSKKFNKVIATEISKTSIKSAKENCALNDVQNIDFIRMSSEEFVEAYTNLFRLGYAYSIECYLEDELVGGLYGVMINDVFCGESMFSKVPDASKVALYHLCKQSSENGIKLIDCQVHNNHLESLGAKEISRTKYFSLLKVKNEN